MLNYIKIVTKQVSAGFFSLSHFSLIHYYVYLFNKITDYTY